MLPGVLQDAGILTPLLCTLLLPGGLSLILLLVLLVFGVHTWNTPFSSIRHQTKAERCSLPGSGRAEDCTPAPSHTTGRAVFRIPRLNSAADRRKVRWPKEAGFPKDRVVQRLLHTKRRRDSPRTPGRWRPPLTGHPSRLSRATSARGTCGYATAARTASECADGSSLPAGKSGVCPQPVGNIPTASR